MSQIFKLALASLVLSLMVFAQPAGAAAGSFPAYDPAVRPGAVEPAAAPATNQPSGLAPEADSAASVEDCQNASATTLKACGDPNSTAGLSGSGKAQMIEGLGMIATIGAQAAAAKGSAKACLLASTLSTGLQAMSLLKAGACSSQIDKCTRVCKEAYEEVDREESQSAQNYANTKVFSLKRSRIRTATNSCLDQSSKVAQMQSQMMMLGMNAMNMLNCKDQSSDHSVAAAPPAPLPTGVGDCSDPSFAATSQYCICKANENDPLCGGVKGGNLPDGTGGLATGGLATPSLTTPGTDEGQLVDQSKIESHPESGKQAGGSGGGNGGGFGNSPPGGLNPEGSDGTGASGIDKNVIVGASSSGGGLSPVGGGGGGGSRGGGAGSGTGSGFNLSKFLPKSMFKNRGLAGMTVPAQDGVTGPMGPTIWEKVHTRYEDKKATLIQDK